MIMEAEAEIAVAPGAGAVPVEDLPFDALQYLLLAAICLTTYVATRVRVAAPAPT
jgi:hypothetical protein